MILDKGLTDIISDGELRDLLGAYGLVACATVIRYKHSGKSAGYGFVEMGSGEQALRAVVALDGARFQGHCLRLFVMPQFSLRSKPLFPQPKESPS